MKLINKILFFSGSLLKKTSFLLDGLMNFKSDSLRIVYYHMISNSDYPFYFDNKAISVKEFKEQLLFFKKRYDIISLSQAIEFAQNRESLKRKLVITFDDGFADNYLFAAPILNDLDLTATFFLIGNCIDNQDLMWRNKLLLIQKVDEPVLKGGLDKVVNQYELSLKGYKNLMSWSLNHFPMDKKEEIVNSLWNYTMGISIEEYLEKDKPYLTSKQIVELSNQGFEFGSHSMSHPNFSKLSYEEFKKEIVDSTVKIEKIINKKVSFFTYPFGYRANLSFEKQLLKEEFGLINTFLGTRNKLNNSDKNIISWERDNLEHSFEIALSRFLLVAAFRNFINKLSINI